MTQVLSLLALLLDIFWYLLIARIVIEMVRSFSRGWSPSGIVAVVFEVVFTISDPPVKALRRVIPPVRLGGISLDLSVLVLFLIIVVLQLIITSVKANL